MKDDASVIFFVPTLVWVETKRINMNDWPNIQSLVWQKINVNQEILLFI